MRGLVLSILTVAVLSACQTTEPALGPTYQGLAPPEGTRSVTESVDQMLVGDRLMEAGEYELALRAYIRAAADRGTDADVMLAIGSANLQLGRLGQAETMFRGAVDQIPDEPVAWNNLGVVLMETGQYGEARGSFERAFALDSGRSDSIRENLRLAIARMENSAYVPPNESSSYELERRGGGRYLLIPTL